MSASLPELDREADIGTDGDQPRWYVVRTRPKTEHLAARQLERHAGVEPFAPRLSWMKTTARGRIRWTEAMFPGYCLVRFRWSEAWRLVNSSPGVTGVVRFDANREPPHLAEEEIADLRRRCGPGELVELMEEFSPGDEVEVAGGPLRGLCSLVTRVLPARRRLAVLMEILGQPREVEVSFDQLAHRRQAPAELRR